MLKKNRMSTAIGHQKQKILQKLGSSGKTVDKIFDELLLKWEQQIKLLTLLEKDLKRQKKLESFVVPLANVAECVSDFFEESESDKIYGHRFKYASNHVADLVGQYQIQQKELLSLIQEYLNRWLALKPKIQDRKNLQLDYDKWRNIWNQYQEKPPKDPSKASQAEAKMETYKDLFEKINDSIIQEISDLYDNRFQDFEHIFKMLVTSQYMLFSSISATFESVSPENVISNLKSNNGSSSNESSLRSTSSTLPLEDNLISNRNVLSQDGGNQKIYMKALFEYKAMEPSELSFEENDLIEVLKKYDDYDWWEGRLLRNGNIGSFPQNFCQLVASPTVKESLPTVKESSPNVNESLPTVKESSPTAKESSPNVKESLPNVKESSPTVKESSPTVKEVSTRLPLRMIAEFDYTAEEPSELSFTEGDVITILEREDDSDWWKGQLDKNGNVGLFPINFCRTFSDESEPKRSLPNVPGTALTKSSPKTDTTNNFESKEKGRRRFKALFGHVGKEKDELSFIEGDIIVLLETSEDSDWWKGKLEVSGKVGLFPRNFFAELE